MAEVTSSVIHRLIRRLHTGKLQEPKSATDVPGILPYDERKAIDTTTKKGVIRTKNFIAKNQHNLLVGRITQSFRERKKHTHTQ